MSDFVLVCEVTYKKRIKSWEVPNWVPEAYRNICLFRRKYSLEQYLKDVVTLLPELAGEIKLVGDKPYDETGQTKGLKYDFFTIEELATEEQFFDLINSSHEKN